MYMYVVCHLSGNHSDTDNTFVYIDMQDEIKFCGDDVLCKLPLLYIIFNSISYVYH